MELGPAPPPPDRRRWAMADRGGRGRVLPDPTRDGSPLRLPGEQDPIPMATCEPRLTATAAESPLLSNGHGGVGEAPPGTGPGDHTRRAPRPPPQQRARTRH